MSYGVWCVVWRCCDIGDLCRPPGPPRAARPPCPPLLHFPANLKHNKRPFYPQNKLTITQQFTLENSHFRPQSQP